MDGKFEQGFAPINPHIPAFFSQQIHSQNSPQAVSANPHTNLLKQGNQFDQITSVKNTLFQNNNEIYSSSLPINVIVNQNLKIKEQVGIPIFQTLPQQHNAVVPQHLLNQHSQTKNILTHDLRLLGGNPMQPVLTTQNNQQIFVSGVQDSMPGNAFRLLPQQQPALFTNGKQDLTNIDTKLSSLNLQNDSPFLPQQNLLFQSQPARLLQNQIFFQNGNGQLVAPQSLLSLNSCNFFGSQSTFGSQNDLQAANQISELNQLNDQNMLLNIIHQQKQQLNQQQQLSLQPSNTFMISENPLNNLQLNGHFINGMDFSSPQALLEKQIKQNQMNMLQQQPKNMNPNQQVFLTSFSDPSQIQKIDFQLLGSEDPNCLLSRYNNLQQPVFQGQNNQNIQPSISQKEQYRKDPSKHRKIDESQSHSSDKTFNYQSKGLQLNNQYSNTLSPQRGSNPSIQSLQQCSSLSQTEKFEEGQQIQNIQQKLINGNNVITSLLDIESQQPINAQAIQIMNSVQQNNKIINCIPSSTNIHNNLQIILQNKSLIQNSNQGEEGSLEDSQEEHTKLSIKQMTSLNGEKNGLSLKQLSHSSSNSSPLKGLSLKKEEKLLNKQYEKHSQQNIISSEHIHNQVSSDSQDKGSKDLNSLANRRNNEDPYQNYSYDSQIKNQLRKQVLKCFFKNVPAYLDKYESEIARQYPCLEKNTLKSLCKYWSQFDNPTKRENLKNEEYKSLCETLSINHEIKPLGQKGIKEVFCKKNDFSEGLKYLYNKFNEESSTFSKRQRQLKMKSLYVETSEEILDDILGRQKRKDQIKSIVSNEDMN